MWFKAKPLAFYQEDTGNTFSSESKYILNKKFETKIFTLYVRKYGPIAVLGKNKFVKLN